MLFFAKNLKFLREGKGLKQSEMIDLCGFKQSTWNGYERGVSTPNIDDLIKISDYFKIAESDLLHIDITEKNLQSLYLYYEKHKNIGWNNNTTGSGSGNFNTGIVEEPPEEYSKPCPECIYLRKTLHQKEETIEALHGQVAALQVAVDALKQLMK